MMSFRCGTFLSPTSTGEASFDPGLPGVPTALFLTTAGSQELGTIVTGARIAFGATDGTNQWSACAAVEFDDATPVVNGDDVMDGQHTTTAVLRIIDHTGLVVAEAEFVSFNLDGTITLDWTTVDADEIVVGYMAWDEVEALAGTTLIDDDETITITPGFKPKVALGANARDVNDGTIMMGWGESGGHVPVSAFGEHGAGYCARVDIGDDFIARVQSGHPYSQNQANTLGNTLGRFENWTDTTVDITNSTVTVVFSDTPVGWLIIGEGGDWFGYGGIPGFGDNIYLANCMTTLGAIFQHARTEVTVDDIRTVSYGAWDPTDSQWAAMNYLEEDEKPTVAGDPDIEPPCFAITSRAIWDDRIAVEMTDRDTVFAYETLANDPGFAAPDLATTGGPMVDQTRGLYFNYLSECEESEPAPKPWAELV